MITLGGNIELNGFREIDGGTMIILKKMIGNYVRRMSDLAQNFEKLTLTMKPVHASEEAGPKKFEINAKAIANGKPYTSEVVDFNLFNTVDKALAKICATLEK